MSGFGEDFGQKVDLTANIRGILRNYPEGTAILKELVQNADDAGARKVSVCLDGRTHSTTGLASPDLAQFQGPALLAYNDSVFTEDDFRSIQRIGDSLKKLEEDQTKIGRFGIGFNAVYHWTDLPSFVSAKKLVMLDPQARFLPDVNPTNPGVMVNWVDKPDVLTRFPDQFAPYHFSGSPIDWTRPFNGTLFRLPLRTAAQAETSTLSKRALGTEDASVILDSLQAEASAMLLFLQNVESIEITYWEAGAPKPTRRFHCELANVSSSLRETRAFVKNKSKHEQAIKQKKEFPADYSLRINCSVGPPGGVTYVEEWEVCNQLGGLGASLIAGLPINSLLRLVPWGGLAACISTENPNNARQSGLAYCFLPLPVQTGLPVMVNGFFELSSNRRDVWQAGADMTGDGKTRAEWNISLMQDIISPCYVRLLMRLKAILGFSCVYQHKWPSTTVGAPWNLVSQRTLALCRKEKLLQVCSSTPELDSFFATGAGESSEVAVKVGRKATWIECEKAVLLPAVGTFGLDAPEDMRSLALYYADTSQPLVLCQAELLKSLCDSGTCEQVGTPKLTRRSLLKDQVAQKVLASVSLVAVRAFLLRYVLQDMKAAQPSMELNTLPVLPMCSGKLNRLYVYSDTESENIAMLFSMGYGVTKAIWALSQTNFKLEQALEKLSGDSAASTGTGKDKDSKGTIIIAVDGEERDVFMGASSILLDETKVGPKEKEFLTHPKMQQYSNIRPFDAALIPDLLHYILHSSFFAGKPVLANKASEKSFNVEHVDTFLRKFWAYSGSRPNVINAIAQNAAIIPAESQDKGGVKNRGFFPLSAMSNLLVTRMDKNTSLDTDMAELLQGIGLNIVDASVFADVGAMPQSFWEYVCKPTRSGVIRGIQTLLRGNRDALLNMSVEGREKLRLYLGSVESINSASRDEVEAIKSFPIFTTFTNKSDKGKYFALTTGKMKADSQARKATIIRADKIPDVLFPEHYICHRNAADLAMLKVFCVPVENRSTFFRDNFLKKIKQNFAEFHKETEQALLEMLSEFPALQEEDKQFGDVLFKAEFIPCGSIVAKAGAESDTPQVVSTPATDGPVTPPGSQWIRRENEQGRKYWQNSVTREKTYTQPPEGVRSPPGAKESAPAAASAGSEQIKLFQPKSLFDPTVKELRDLLDETFFPDTPFQQSNVIAILRAVGLQQTMDWRGILTCAGKISSSDLNIESVEIRQNRAVNLLQFLNTNIGELLDVNKPKVEEKGWNKGFFSSFSNIFTDAPEEKPKEPVHDYLTQLQQLKWVPVMTEPEHVCMPWVSDSTRGIAAPSESSLHADIWLCSSVRRVITQPVTNARLKEAMQWNKPLPAKTIATQLHNLSIKFLELKKAEEGANTGLDDFDDASASGSGLLQQARETVTGLIPQLYQRLNSGADDKKAAVGIKEILFPAKWIWVGKTFVHTSMVALTASVNASPYLFQLPQDLRVYGKLLRAFNVKTGFTPNDYVQVLHTMAEETGQLDSDPKTGKALPLPSVDLACSLVTLLSAEGSITSRSVKEIYAPDDAGRLALTSGLINDDVPWMSGPQYITIRQGCRLVHPNISASVAEKIGVRSLRASLLDKNLESGQMFGDENNKNMEAFGQGESLTARLKTILDMYPDGNPIFSELIQNADDAGASVVRIMLDVNTYSSESLLDSRMTALQGPSLIVCNDAVFTEADFRSLARIGHGHKLEKVSATGRFGLGFNSTYHLTDTPTFVSGEHLVIFDPHCKHAPGATVNQPGLKIKCVGTSLPSTFKDQFQPFEYFGCDFKSAYKGSLFRFPLRTAGMARESEISSRSYSIEDVNANINQLVKQLSHYLLFLRSVKTIEIYSLDKGQTTPELLHRAEAKTELLDQENDQRILRYFDKKASGPTQTRDQFYAELMSLPNAKLPEYCQRQNVRVRAFVNGEVNVTEDTEYVIQSGLCGGKAKELAVNPATRKLKLIPLGSVAACISRQRYTFEEMQNAGKPQIEDVSTPAATDGPVTPPGSQWIRRENEQGRKYWQNSVTREKTFTKPPPQVVEVATRPATNGTAPATLNLEMFPPIQGQAFCFLPLPVQTHLPVHCNAYWELSSNRRDIWRGDDTQGEAKIRSDWNIHVMNDVLAPMYSKLLKKIKMLVDKKQEKGLVDRDDILGLLPCPLPAEPWDALGKSLFWSLKDAKILWSNVKGGCYTSLSASHLLETNFIEDSQEREDTDNAMRDELEKILLGEELNIVRVPKAVLTSVVGLNVTNAVTPASVRSFYSNQAVHPTLEVTSNATFLLRFCFRDVTNKNYEVLDGLPLVPLESDKLGTFRLKNPNDYTATLFLVKESERSLLQKAPHRILADLAKLESPLINQCFKDPIFAEVLNIKIMDSSDFVSILRSFLPPFWYTSDFAYVVDRSSQFESDWLFNLWKYLLEENIVLQFFKGDTAPPLLPIIRPPKMRQGKFIVRLTDSVPVLHMMYRHVKDEVVSCFEDVGIYIFDPDVLGSLSFSEKIGQFISTPDPKGVLSALCTVQTLIIAKNDWSAWPAEQRRAFRYFLLDEVLSKLVKSQVSDEDLNVIRKLPVWERYGYAADDVAAFDSFDPEADMPYRLPPKDVAMNLMNDSFFVIRPNKLELDMAAYALIGVKTTLKATFYITETIPAIVADMLDAESVDSVTLDMLRNLQKLEREHAGFGDVMKEARIIRSNDNELYKPCDLYDPQLGALLPNKVFPLKAVFDDRYLIQALRTVGLRTTVDCDAVLAAAAAIETDSISLSSWAVRLKGEGKPEEAGGVSWAARLKGEGKPEEAGGVADYNPEMESVVRRSISLMKYIEQNMENLLKDADPASLERAVNRERVRQGLSAKFNSSKSAKNTLRNTSDAEDEEVDTESEDTDDMEIGAEWGDKLRRLAWIPVYSNPPVKTGVDGLPWPKNLHSTPLAAPCQCVPLEDTWIASSTKRISTYDVKDELFKNLLGWNLPPSGRNCALQLLNVQRMFEEASNAAKDRLASSNGVVVTRLLGALSDALELETADQIKLWLKVVANRAVIWIAGQFVEPSRIAFRGLPGVNTEPYLFVVSAELLVYKALLVELGVRESFGPQDLASLMRKMHDSYETNSNRSIPMTTQQTDVAVGILKLLVNLLNDNKPDRNGEGLVVEGNGSHTGSPTMPEAAPAATDGPVTPPGSQWIRRENEQGRKYWQNSVTREKTYTQPPVGEEASTRSATHEEQLLRQQQRENSPTPLPAVPRVTVSIEELRPMFIPDRKGFLVESKSLTYDDAPWITSSIAGKSNHMHFVHMALTCDDARVLGATSLREQLFAGDDIMCPAAKGLKSALGNDSSTDMITDLLALADTLSATSFDLMYDMRTHKAESLLHPGLAEAQGPALIVHIGGPVLKSEDISKVLTAPHLLKDLDVASMQFSAGAGSPKPIHGPALGDSQNNGSGSTNFNTPYPASGKRLLSAFAVTDCLQVISGSEFYVFDPCGLHLFSGESVTEGEDNARQGTGSRAQRCELSLRTRFPDQFLGFTELPLKLEHYLDHGGSFPGLIIRMPLRRQASGISKCIPNEAMVKRSARSFGDLLSGSLVFSNSIIKGSCSHFNKEGGDMVTDLQLSLTSSLEQRNSRRALLLDKNWKKSGISSWVSSFVAPTKSYTVEVTKKKLPRGWLYGEQFLAGDDDEEEAGAVAIEDTSEEITHNKWFLISAQGAGVIKDIASRSEYRAHKLPPFCTIAVRNMDAAELSRFNVKPDTGMAYCNGAPVCITGLPFHVEGPYIQHVNDRHVSFFPVRDRPSGAGEPRALWNSTQPAARRQSMFGFSDSKDNALKQLTGTQIEIWNKSLLLSVLNELFKPAIYQMALQSQPTPGFYKYWPFLPAMTKDVQDVCAQSQLYPIMIKENLFLTRAGFGLLNQTILPTLECPLDVLSYLQTVLPVAMCPMQVSQNLDLLEVQYTGLTPSKLRSTLEKDFSNHCGRLRSRYLLVLNLLNYCTSDVRATIETATGGEFSKRTAYNLLAGVPLLPMSDGSIRPFPKFAKDQVCFAPLVLHALLPRLRKHFIHPTFLDRFSLFKDEIAQSTLRMNRLSAKVLAESMNLVLPDTWKLCEAVRWTTGSTVSNDLASTSAFHTSSGVTAASTEVVLYALWKEFLSLESQENLDALKDWPLVPTVSRGRRLMVSPQYLFTLFYLPPTEEQNAHRDFLASESGRMASFLEFDAGDLPPTDGNRSDDWAWTTPPPSKRATPRITSRGLGHNFRQRKPRSVAGEDAAGREDATQCEDEDDDILMEQLPAAAALDATAMSTINEGQIIVQGNLARDSMYNAGDGVVEAEEAGQSGRYGPGLRVVTADAINVAEVAAEGSATGNGVDNVDGVDNVAHFFATHTPDSERDADMEILRLIERLGVPMLDLNVFEGPPAAITQYLASAEPTMGKRLLTCLYMLSGEQELYVHAASTLVPTNDLPPASPSGTLVDDGASDPAPLLDFDALSAEDRITLLEQIAPSRGLQLSDADILKIRKLRLFTEKRTGRAISIHKSKRVYCCQDDSVLEAIPKSSLPYNPAANAAPTTPPARSAMDGMMSMFRAAGGGASAQEATAEDAIVLVKHPRLATLYDLLGVKELTAALAVREFTVPALRKVPGLERLIIMRKLSKSWGQYKSDQELVTMLKPITFLPTWSPAEHKAAGGPNSTDDPDDLPPPPPPEQTKHTGSRAPTPTEIPAEDAEIAYFRDPDSDAALRSPAQVMSWKNRDLIDALQGKRQGKYFPPPWVRDTPLHDMLVDLGMSENLTKEFFLDAAKSIETDLSTEIHGNLDPNYDENTRECATRSRRLLRYVQDNDRSLALFDNEVAKKLSKVRFVPVLIPQSVDAGGYVNYDSRIVSFSETLSNSAGALGFSCMPVLDSGISPHQIFYSSLGVMSTPDFNVVMKHLMALTANGTAHSLDRWNNTTYSVIKTFGAIFTRMQDQWDKIGQKFREKLFSLNIVPVGDALIRPGRLYFRLNEDLSPFMHEVPRHFGQHEAFLKNVGVRESPSARDYSLFLRDLEEECHGHSLNANELRATVAIIDNIARERAEIGAATAGNLLVFTPDEDSILRDSRFCLLNDDPSVRARAGDSLFRAVGMHMIHPSVSRSVTKQLGVQLISDVLVERIAGETLDPATSPPEVETQQRINDSLCSVTVVRCLAALVSKAREVGDSSGADSSAGGVGEGEQTLLVRLRTLQLRFVKGLATVLAVVRDGREQIHPDTRVESLSFTQAVDERQSSSVMYINVRLLDHPITAEIAVALCLCKMLRMDTSLAAAVAALLAGGESSCERVMHTLRVGTDAVTLRERQRGMPGERLCKTDADLVELKPFRSFRVGEAVAYSVTLDDGAGSADSAESLRYARVLSIMAPEDDNSNVSPDIGLRRIVLKTTAEVTRTMLTTEIYSFRSARELAMSLSGKHMPAAPVSAKPAAAGGGFGGTTDGPVTPPGSQWIRRENEQGRKYWQNSVTREKTYTQPPEPSDHVRSPLDAKEAVPAAISAAPLVETRAAVNQSEILAAMESLAVRAGLPVGLEQHALAAKVMDMDSNIKRAQNDLLAERAELNETRGLLTKMNAVFKCQVCLDEDFDHAFVPCGHTVCHGCMVKMEEHVRFGGLKCPFCRQKVTNKVKLFLPEPDNEETL